MGEVGDLYEMEQLGFPDFLGDAAQADEAHEEGHAGRFVTIQDALLPEHPVACADIYFV